MNMQSTENTIGVYFVRESYACFWRRLVIEIVDISVIMMISVTSTMLITEFSSSTEQLIDLLFLLWGGLWFAYFVLLKRSSFGTLGYKLCKVRVVNLKGERPSILALTFRLMFAIVGPLNILLDLIWLSGDDNRQALRDKFAQTYVVKKNATAIGNGIITYCNYDLWGWHVIFREVKKTEAHKSS